MYIDGRWVTAGAGASRVIVDPADGSELAIVAEGDRGDARAAIRAARTAFDQGPWRDTTRAERAAVLEALADRIAAQAEELALLETRDTGKPLPESRWDIDDVVAVFRYYADLARGAEPERLIPPVANASSVVVAEPIGVCGLILPWNYPLLQASWKLAPALAAGCTVVVKPSELTPLSTLRLTELAAEAGVPRGVFNTVLGPGPTVGAELADSADVDLLSFTGGSRTGRLIMAAAAANLKRVAHELGGKNPHIVFADADLEVALDQALNAVFFHAGQVCSAGARLLLERSIADDFVAGLRTRIGRIKLGDGRDPDTQMGPLISAAHRAGVAAGVRGAVDQGAELLCGGSEPADPALQRGFYYLPTLLDRCDGLDISRTEIFGPVIGVERFDTEQEAVRRANDTVYGLAAGIWTGDDVRARRVSAALRFGTVWINDFNVYFPQAPWGGYKQSGIGRELGRVGLAEYLEHKHVFHNHAPAALDHFGAS